MCCTASRQKERKIKARGEEEADLTDDGDSEGSEMSQDLLNEADFEQLVKEAESFTVKSTQRPKMSSATQQEKGIILEPIILMSPAGDYSSSEGLGDTADECGDTTDSTNTQLESVLMSQEDLPLQREFSPLTLSIPEEPTSPARQCLEGPSLLTPTTPVVASSVDGSDGTTPTPSARGEEAVWEEASSDFIQPLAGEDCQTPALVVLGEPDHSGLHGNSRFKSSSPPRAGCDYGTGERHHHHPPPAPVCGAQELEPPLDSTVSGSSSECTSPLPVMGDRLVGLVPMRNPFDDSDSEDDNEERGGGGERDAISSRSNESDGGGYREAGRVGVLTCNADSPKDQDKVGETPELGKYPLTLEEITVILNNGEDDKLEGFLDEYDIVDALQEDYYTKEVRVDCITLTTSPCLLYDNHLHHSHLNL